MSVIDKDFSGKPDGAISEDTKLSMMDIVNFLQEDTNNIAKVHEAALNGNLDCQIFLSQITHQTLQDQADDPSLDVAQTHKNHERYTRLAAEQGDAESQFKLAQYYLKMVDMTKGTINEEEANMLKEARHWFKQAASNGRDNLSEIISSLEEIK